MNIYEYKMLALVWWNCYDFKPEDICDYTSIES